jgi:GNAT superfamily N-acetyltransferase
MPHAGNHSAISYHWEIDRGFEPHNLRERIERMEPRGTSLEVRAFKSSDAGPVDALLWTLWGHDTPMLAIYRFMHREWPAGRWLRRTLVAAIGDEVVGAGTLFENSLSPGRLHVTINVAVDHQRQGAGSALFDRLTKFGDGRPWLAQVAPRRDPPGWAFLTARGFRVAISTLTGTIDPHSEPVRAWMASLPAEIPGYAIVPADSALSAEKVALVHAAIARRYHAWNPMVEISAEQALAIFGGDRVIPGSQLCVYAGDELVGVAHLTAHPFKPDAGEVYLVNFGLIDDRPSANDLTAALLRRCLEFAAEHGLRVGFEVDDPYEPHRSLLEAAPATDVSHDFVIMVNDDDRDWWRRRGYEERSFNTLGN